MRTKQLNKNEPRVSVLMTIYNAENYLKEAIDSILKQTFSDWELIAVEDGSTDQSPAILSSYNDSRIRVFFMKKNIGRTPALRHAFEQVRGEYIAILDADDMSHQVRFERQVEYLDQHPEIALLGTWAKVIDKCGKQIGEVKPTSEKAQLLDLLGWTNPLVHSSTMYRRTHAQQIGGYPAWVTYAQDYGLYLGFAKKFFISMLDEFLCYHRVSSTQMTNSKKYRRIIPEEQVELLRYALNTLKLSARSRRLNKRSQAVSEIRLGMTSFLEGEYLRGSGKVISNIVKCPSALWGNGPVRRLFGSQL